ncbi:MAG: hypothetical protein IPF99_33350 [Deltaproteobacteria bacterium]|nr:hypothetical protein [Deltaproteobacteria bacterium]
MLIYDATVGLRWPGEADATVCVVHLAIGNTKHRASPARLNGREVLSIDSSLRAGSERPDPTPLQSNVGLSFKGVTLYGQGFLLTQAERDNIVRTNPASGDRLLRYVGGEHLNSTADQWSGKYAIYLTDLTLDEAERGWPLLLDIVREKVKPERDQLGGYSVADSRRESWWKYGTPASELRQALRGKERCIAAARVTKHLCFQ